MTYSLALKRKIDMTEDEQWEAGKRACLWADKQEGDYWTNVDIFISIHYAPHMREVREMAGNYQEMRIEQHGDAQDMAMEGRRADGSWIGE